jgi:hypothetical protein
MCCTKQLPIGIENVAEIRERRGGGKPMTSLQNKRIVFLEVTI